MVVYTVVVACLLLTTVFGVFFMGKHKDEAIATISFIVATVAIIYFTYLPLRKAIKNEPVIVLTDDSIVLNTPRSVVIPKSEIRIIDVDYVKESGYFLNIKTDKENHVTSISWLDKTPDQLKSLIKKYQP